MIKQKYIEQVYWLSYRKSNDEEKSNRMVKSFVKIVEKQKPDDEHIERMILIYGLDKEFKL